MNWYIVQAYSGFEKKVAETIKDTLKKSNLDSNLEEVLVPTHQVTEVKKGKRTKKEKKYFPGYVLIRVDLTKQIYHLIKNLQKVSGFLGSENKPTPITDTEIKRIITLFLLRGMFPYCNIHTIPSPVCTPLLLSVAYYKIYSYWSLWI